MLKHFGKKKKYFFILMMVTLTVALFIYLLKKAMQKRDEFLKRLEDEKNEGHSKAAIMEEQEEQKIKDINPKEDVVIDLKDYIHYQEFLPVRLWSKQILSLTTNIDQTYCLDLDTTEHHYMPSIELLLYYQPFVKLFRINILSVTNLSIFQSNDRKFLKIKIFLVGTDITEKSEEMTRLYEILDEVFIDEKFSFHMFEKDFAKRSLYLTFWSVDVFYRELLIGALSIDLRFYDYKFRKTIKENVIPVKKDLNVYGHLLVSLCHLPQVERLVCVVMSGKRFQDDIKSQSILDKGLNPFVKVFLLSDGKLLKKCRTNTCRETDNPLFNEMLEFYVPQHQLQSIDILFLVMHHDLNESNRIIGKLLIGCHSCNDALRHWNDVIDNSNVSVAKWHPLSR